MPTPTDDADPGLPIQASEPANEPRAAAPGDATPTTGAGSVTGGRDGNGVARIVESKNPGMDGLLEDVGWATNKITFSYPTTSSVYGTQQGKGPGEYSDPAPFNGLAVLSAAQQADTERAFALIAAYTKATFSLITETDSVHATIRLANSKSPPTAYAYGPGEFTVSGDVFFGTTGLTPAVGDFDSAGAVLHEIGHALGLTHGQDPDGFGKMPATLIDQNNSLMNYPSFVGDKSPANVVVEGGMPQTFMRYDIASLQYLYGANLDKLGQTETYGWAPDTGAMSINGKAVLTPQASFIFSTVWTGGSNATYDLTAFKDEATLDLRPGGAMLFSRSRLSDLGYNVPGERGQHFADGNVFNAFLYNGDTRTEVTALKTGDGRNTVLGNDRFDTITLGSGDNTVMLGSGGGLVIAGAGANTLTGGAATDYFDFGNTRGANTADGGDGRKIALFGGKFTDYTIVDNAGTITVTSKDAGSKSDVLTHIQVLQFADRVVQAASLSAVSGSGGGAGSSKGGDEPHPDNPPDPVAGGRGGNDVVTVVASGDQGVDGLLSATAWANNVITYSIPTSASFYGSKQGTGDGEYPDPAPFNAFETLNAAQIADADRAFALVASYTKATFTKIIESDSIHATIRLANSAAPKTAYAYLPSTDITGGDIFFGVDERDPAIGNVTSGTGMLHEIGHALGLSHGHEADFFGKMPATLIDNQNSLMNYPAFVGDTSTSIALEAHSAPQTYMQYDIAALQYLYGANFSKIGSGETYTWSPTTGEMSINKVGQGTPSGNRIFDTIWTEGATATYDLRGFNDAATLDLRPGAALKFSNAQIADLGGGIEGEEGKHLAAGNIYNALLYNGDTRSEVSGMLTGDGDVTVFGNDVFDTIVLGAGKNTVTLGSGGGYVTVGTGVTTIQGGSATDYVDFGNTRSTGKADGGGGSNIALFGGGIDSYEIHYNAGVITVTSKEAGAGTDTLTNFQVLQFADVAVQSAVLALACFVGGTRIATEAGEVAVEDLRVGTRVVTADGMMPITWIGHRTVDCARHPKPRAVWPVRVTAGAFGDGLPRRDLWLSPDHAVHVDEVLIPIGRLADGDAIAQVPRDRVTYWHVELATHQVIRAEGLPVESYLETGGRDAFASGGGATTLHPAFAPLVWDANSCAPLVLTGPVLERAKRRVRGTSRHAA